MAEVENRKTARRKTPLNGAFFISNAIIYRTQFITRNKATQCNKLRLILVAIKNYEAIRYGYERIDISRLLRQKEAA